MLELSDDVPSEWQVLSRILHDNIGSFPLLTSQQYLKSIPIEVSQRVVEISYLMINKEHERNPVVFLSRGYTYLRLGEDKKALVDFDRALELIAEKDHWIGNLIY